MSEKNTTSEKKDTSNTMSCCASCGKVEGDDIQLRTCTACKSVRYCGVACQRNHRSQHKKACKKRAAELRDEILFKQPESSHMGDCPICLLPLPLDEDKYSFHACCSKQVCIGCIFANTKHRVRERLEHSCPFCRADLGGDQIQKMMKRAQANDPSALCYMGGQRHNEGKFVEAFDYYSKAAELGDANAHFNLSLMYKDGQGVEKDEKKEVYHLEEAAIRGHPDARSFLARYLVMKGRFDRAMKHFIIASNLGSVPAMGALKASYQDGSISKDDFASALRAHHAAIDAMKSPQRDEAAEAFEAARMK